MSYEDMTQEEVRDAKEVLAKARAKRKSVQGIVMPVRISARNEATMNEFWKEVWALTRENRYMDVVIGPLLPEDEKDMAEFKRICGLGDRSDTTKRCGVTGKVIGEVKS
jgi:hypothetical protein